MTMKVCFRTDSSVAIGSGHLMRCLTLAGELRKRGAEILFISREHPSNLNHLPEAKGYPVRRLDNAEKEYVVRPWDVAHAAWLGVPWEQDTIGTIAVLGEVQPDWLVVDHYAIDRRWEEQLRPHVGRILVIDDLADRSHDCDLLLDQNYYEAMGSRYNGLVPTTCQKLLGPKYALLRPEFAAARKSLRRRDGQVHRVLVFFGGVDPTNETRKALQALAGVVERRFAVDVVVGGGNPYKEEIRNFCEAHNGFSYHCQVDNMAELMAAADLAIGAGGSTTWERCVMGLPALVMSVAENQIKIADNADKAGVLSYLGKSLVIGVSELSQKISDVLQPKYLVCMSEKALHLVDCNGLNRVVDGMEIT